MRRLVSYLSVLAVAAVMATGMPRPLEGQDFNQCWSDCHAFSMLAAALYSDDYATVWFKGCINTNCPELAPI